jgi:hypothetical protein
MGLVFMTLRSKIQPCWESGYLSYLRRRGLGKPFLRGNTLVRKRYLRFFRNRVIHILGWTYGNEEVFLWYGFVFIKDGSEIRFWEDKWLGNATLWEQYLALYRIVRHKGDTLAKVMESSPPPVTFRRGLSGQRLVAWNALLQRLANIQLQDGHDEFRWNLHKNGKFAVASIYNALILPDVPIDKLSNNKL